ncbi:MAG: hypothetical protein HY654_05030 [Acidobacteria bacterium]|nr:hypothetical protein [Acidobacteriota bacterium]
MRRYNIVEPAAVTAAAIALTVCLTYPLVPRLGEVGRIDTGDGQVSIWNVAWVARALIERPARLFDANIFHPTRGTLAFSEANLAAGAIAVPVYWLTRNPIAAHNSAMAMAFVLAAISMYALARHLTGNRIAAAFAGIAFAFCPFMYARTAHIQLVMTAGLPFSLLMLHRFVEQRTAGRAAWLGTGLASQALACGYYGIFAGLAVSLAVVFYAISRRLWRDWQYAAGLAGAATLATLLMLPIFTQYQSLRSTTGFGRTLEEAVPYSADWRSYLASSTYAHKWMLPLLGGWNDVLFPGVLVLALGLAAFIMIPRDARANRARETMWLYVLLGAAAFWCSLGPTAGLYTVLYEVIPLFAWLRAPARMGIVVTLALAVLAALTIARLLERPPRTRAPLSAAMLLLLVAELVAMPLPFRQVPPPAEAYRILARLPRGAVVELPFYWQRIDFYRHARYMLTSTYHWQPLVNGYSDYIPPDFRAMVVAISSFPTRESFNLLRPRGVRYAVFHLHHYDTRSREKLLERLEAYREFLAPLWQQGPIWLYEVVAWPE